VAWALVALGAAVQLWLGSAVGLGDDEALYWVWSRHPGRLTVDHPPLVAWLIAGGRLLLGDGSLAVRAPFVGLGVVTSGVLGAWTRSATGSAEAGSVAMLVVAVAPLFAIGHVFAAPDMPLWCATAVVGFALDRALFADRTAAWAVAGLAVGFGLWAKLTMALVPVSVLGFMLLTPKLRRRLGTPGPWVAAGLALAVWSPWLVQQHGSGWPTLRFHLVERHGEAPGLAGLAAMAGGQLGYVSPLLAVLLLVSLVRHPGWSLRSHGLPAALAIPPIAFFTMSGVWTHALPHWSGGGWLAAVVPGTLVLLARPRVGRWAVGLAASLSVIVHVQAWVPVLPLGPADPTHDLHGWRALGSVLGRLASSADAQGCLPALRGTRYQTASQAAHALGWAGPEVHPLARPLGHDVGTIRDPPERCGDTLVVASDRFPLHGAECPVSAEVPVVRGAAVVRTLRIHRCPVGWID